jgi:prolyl-tRNA editing enzyme YbaK/EbsC (Cys-tRNA(Pro) deacylase)
LYDVLTDRPERVFFIEEGGVMGYEAVKKYFEEHQIPNEIILLEESSATVELAAKALGREPGEIAKTLAMELKDGTHFVLVVMGTARIDNRKYKDRFGCKAKMLSFEETQAVTGHPVGGVCPFGLPEGIKVFLDESLKAYGSVFPAAGTGNSAVEFTPEDLARVTGGVWVDVTKDSDDAQLRKKV